MLYEKENNGKVSMIEVYCFDCGEEKEENLGCTGSYASGKAYQCNTCGSTSVHEQDISNTFYNTKTNNND